LEKGGEKGKNLEPLTNLVTEMGEALIVKRWGKAGYLKRRHKKIN